jgi:hypothetical protein
MSVLGGTAWVTLRAAPTRPGVAGSQLCVSRGKHFLDEHRSVGKRFVLAIELGAPR